MEWNFVNYFIILSLIQCYKCDFFVGTARNKIELLKQKNIFNKSEKSQRCLQDLFKYIEDLDLQKSWAVYMNDAGASNVEPGQLLNGAWSNAHLGDYGNGYEKCLETKHENITGSYCIINLYLRKYIDNLDPDVQKRDHVKGIKRILDERETEFVLRYYQMAAPIRIRLAACLPDSCTPDILNELNLLSENYKVSDCHTKKQLDEYRSYGIMDYSFVLFMSGVVLLMVVGTWRDMRGVVKSTGRLDQLISAFSLVTNGRELLESSGKSKSYIGCIAGFRTVSCIYVLTVHGFYKMVYLPLNNYLQIDKVFTSTWKAVLFEGTFSMEIFHLMGGIVMAYSFLNTHYASAGLHFNPLRHYWHRYVRLTPVIAVTLWFHVTLLRNVNPGAEIQGPLWHENPNSDGLLQHLRADCKQYSWTILIFMQNWLATYNMCLEQLWYVATDFQLTLISPIILMLLASRICGKTIKLIILNCIIAGATLNAVWVHYSNGYNAYVIANIQSDYGHKFFVSTTIRCGPWFLGIMSGYILYEAPNNVSLNKWLQDEKKRNILLKLCTAILLLFQFSMLLLPQHNHLDNFDLFLHAIVAVLRKLISSAALAIIIYTLHVITPNSTSAKLFSHPICQFLSKITYSAYVTHMTILYLALSYVLNSIHFNPLSLIAEAIGFVIIFLCLGTFCTLAIEMPFTKIEKIYFPESKTKIYDPEIINAMPGNGIKPNGDCIIEEKSGKKHLE